MVMHPEQPDFENMPISGLTDLASKALELNHGILPLIQLNEEAKARLARIPDVEGIFSNQRIELERLIVITNEVYEQSKLPAESLSTVGKGMGY